MSTLIAMQDIRQSLASIANRAQKGEDFVVVRNSRPVFRIVPVGHTDDKLGLSFEDITSRIDDSGAAKHLSETDVDNIIHRVHKRASA